MKKQKPEAGAPFTPGAAIGWEEAGAVSGTPYRQSVLLHDKLEAEGVKNEFVTIPGGLHGKFPPAEKAKVSRDIIDFIAACGITR